MSTREMFIDKSSWTITKFGDVAIQQKVNVNREDTTLTKYVKGEHMSSEDIHLRSWGELQDEYLGPAFIRYFEEGDILYGSRRTYLKKVSIAPFEGITSNTTFVIKANEEKIDKRLLPFLMLSDGFTEHSIMHSKGSVNPYINWKDLAKYEFLLPPKDQQAELAELLWANQNLSDSRKDLFHNLKDAYLSQIEKSLISKHAPKVSLHELTDVIRGIGYKPDELMEKMDNSSFVLLRSNNIDQGRINFDQIQILPLSKLKEEQLLRVGDFAICMSNGSKKLVGKLAPFYFSENPTSIGSFCAILRPKTLQAQKIILHLGESLTYRQMIERMISGSAINNLKPEDIYSLFFRVNYQNIQNTLLHLDNLRLMQEVVMNDRIKINELQKSIINQIF